MNKAVLSLANQYARYFVEDFARGVMGNLKGSYPLTPDQFDTVVQTTTTQMFGEGQPVTIASTNTVTRFLYECAEFALQQNSDEPESRQMWDQVSALESIHHDEIQALKYESAVLYRQTLENTVMNTVARDAHKTAQAILTAAQARIATEETGGTVHSFNWGLLNDGLWLNSALTHAFDKVSIFRPGDTPVAYWAKTAFNAAHQTETAPALTSEQAQEAAGQLDLLVSHLNEAQDYDTQQHLYAVLFNRGALGRKVAEWELGETRAAYAVTGVTELSNLAQSLMALRELAKSETLSPMVSDIVKQRLDSAYESVTMSLVGYQALRDSKYANTLIMAVAGEGDDPKVEVTVNADAVSQYRDSGGDENDFIQFGLHYDPRKGIPTQSGGWGLESLLIRRDDIVPQMMSERMDRLEKLRNNDITVIRKAVIDLITPVAQAYLSAKSDRYDFTQTERKISELSRKVTGDNPTMNLEGEIHQLLVSTLSDPLVEGLSNRLMGHVATESNIATCAAMAIAETAMTDAFEHVTVEDKE